ncbi:MAG: hypothetical protein BWY71_01744 [Planctomycetes bacterium ADurb.Bin412]|nr:MAG: hypothetical protein BWY71_01744 [Planctomycetes bacterium ADurb.Bin412]
MVKAALRDRMGPFSRSIGRKVNPPALVQTVTRLSRLGAGTSGPGPVVSNNIEETTVGVFRSRRSLRTYSSGRAIPCRSSASGETGPMMLISDSSRPSQPVFSEPGWKPHSISTSIRFQAPNVGVNRCIAGTGAFSFSQKTVTISVAVPRRWVRPTTVGISGTPIWL